jgi:hypothetical protein
VTPPDISGRPSFVKQNRLFLSHFGALKSGQIDQEISDKSSIRIEPLFEIRLLLEFDDSGIDASSPDCRE